MEPNKRGHNTYRQFLRLNGHPRPNIRQHGENRAQKQSYGKSSAVICTNQHPRNMWHHQADEAYDATHRNCHTDNCSRHNEHPGSEPINVQTEGTRCLFPTKKEIEI